MIEHVSGDKNVWADMHTRWAVKPRTKVSEGIDRARVPEDLRSELLSVKMQEASQK